MMLRVILLAIFLSGSATAGATDTGPPSPTPEDTTPDGNTIALTATYLLNLAWFVSWPDTALGQPEAPFRIGVLGHENLKAAVVELAEHSLVRRRSVTVHAITSVDELDSHHILFVSEAAGEDGQLAAILAAVHGRPILTVGDQDDFIELGGHIRFVTGRSATSLQINRAAAEAAGLRISSKLLSLAEVVAGPETAEKD